MFSHCTRVLHLAEGAAYNRIEAAQAARRYPVILDLLEQSVITLTAVRLLAPHLTTENHVAALGSARHKSKAEIEELVAALKPKRTRPPSCGSFRRQENIDSRRRTHNLHEARLFFGHDVVPEERVCWVTCSRTSCSSSYFSTPSCIRAAAVYSDRTGWLVGEVMRFVERSGARARERVRQFA